MPSRLTNVLADLRRAVWETDTRKLPAYKVIHIKLLRIVSTAIHEFADGQLTLRAMSLVYTTLLSMVPLLAVSFSVLKAFGVHNQFEEVLLSALTALGEKGVEITERIIGFVDNVRVGVLGSVGLLLLFVTVVMLIQKVELSFNYIWRVAQARNPIDRFSHYLSMVLIGPVLIFSAVGITALITGSTGFQAIAAIEPLGWLIRLSTNLIPYLLVIAAFVLAYVFIPNTSVHWSAAIVGGVVAGVLWQTTGWAFQVFVVSSAKYTAIYSSFAILILFMIWLYISWLILLVGASVAFYYQHPEYLGVRSRVLFVSGRLRERLALQVMHAIVLSHYDAGPRWSLQALAQRVNVPVEPVRRLINALEGAGIVTASQADPPLYIPAKDPASVPIVQVLEVVRAAGETAQVNWKRVPGDAVVDEIIGLTDGAVKRALGTRSLADLANEDAMSGVSELTLLGGEQPNRNLEPQGPSSGDVRQHGGTQS